MIVLPVTKLVRKAKQAFDLVEQGETVLVERRGILFEIRLATHDQTGVETLEQALERLFG